MTSRFRFPVLLTALLFASGCSREKPAPEPRSDEPATSTSQTSEDAELESGASESSAPAAHDTSSGGTLEVVTADELRRKLRASGRKGTLVNAWASFCGPCKREIPMLERLAERFRPRGIDVILVSVDEPADEAKALAFLREHEIELTSYLAARPLGAFKRGMNPRWPGMLPASFLFDEQATLRYYWGGEAFESEVTPVLEDFSSGKPLTGESSPPVAAEPAAE